MQIDVSRQSAYLFRAQPTHAPEGFMLVTTTPAIEGRRITKYCGIVTREALLGTNVFKDVFGLGNRGSLGPLSTSPLERA